MRRAESIRTGGRYFAKCMAEREYCAGSVVPYPGWFGNNIPVEIEAEYPRFYVCNVLPHVNNRSFGLSGRYIVTIDKVDIEMGIFKIYEE